MELTSIYIIFSLIFGVCFGSFITMASYRLPRDEDIFFKKSYCPKCNKAIKLYSLIPIFSWLFQGGKCSNCKNKISFRYPLTEIITSLLFLISFFKFGVSYNTIILDLLIVVFMIMIISDLETYIIPDSMQISFLILSLIFIYLNNFNIFYSSISGFIYLVLIYFSSFLVEKFKKKEVLGWADVKFIAIAGLILGIENLSIFFFFSGLIGIFFALFWKIFKKNEYFPFGPSLIIAYLIIFLILKKPY